MPPSASDTCVIPGIQKAFFTKAENEFKGIKSSDNGYHDQSIRHGSTATTYENYPEVPSTAGHR
jgi:hypothetical protein